MFEILVIDNNLSRSSELITNLIDKKWQASSIILNNSIIDRINAFNGLLLVLDQDEKIVNDILDACSNENSRVILTNIAVKTSLKSHDHVFYLAQSEPVDAIIKQIEALDEVIEAQLLMPVAVDPKSKSLFQMLRKVARSYAPVLINGETGVGKEVIARYVHHHSLCSNGPFIAVNCAALPENMIEAMLFGHEKGAFTGAVTSYAGKFEQAQNGTLLLDEISELPLALQSKILRALQEKEVERIGGKKPVKINARIIAATNRDLNDLVNKSCFRKDLYYRLNVIPVSCLPLRERQIDIIPLAELFIKKYAQKLEKQPAILSDQAKLKLSAYSWPGNIRELDNVIHRTLVLCDSHSIEASDIDIQSTSLNLPVPDTSLDSVNFSSRLDESEAKAILETLQEAAGSRSLTAQILKISPRTLRYKIARLREQGVVVP